MRSLRLALAAIPLIVAASAVAAQQPGQIPRVAPTTGLADSSLFVCTDSTKALTRACKFSDVQKRLAYKAFDSLVTANIRITGTCTGCGGSVLVTDSLKALANGAAATPSLAFANSTGTGLYRVGPDSLGIAASGRFAAIVRDSQMLAVKGRVGKPTYSFNAAATTGMFLGSSNQIVFANGGSTLLSIFGSQIAASNQIAIDINGSVGTPALKIGSNSSGLYQFGTDTLGVATIGAHSLDISGGATVKLRGGAGSMTVQAGTGNSRAMTLQTTTSAGTVKNTLVLGADTSATFLGSVQGTSSGLHVLGGTANQTPLYLQAKTSTGVLVGWSWNTVADSAAELTGHILAIRPVGTSPACGRPTLGMQGGGSKNGIALDSLPAQGIRHCIGGTVVRVTGSNRDSLSIRAVYTGDTIRATSKVRFTALTTAAGTPNSVCMNSATKELTENAATSCVVSSRRFKKDIEPLSLTSAKNIVAALRPVTFTYRSGERKAIGLIAEEADSVDSRLSFRDAKGLVNSVAYEEVTILLLKVVQQQQKTIDSLVAAGKKKP